MIKHDVTQLKSENDYINIQADVKTRNITRDKEGYNEKVIN